ncbi:MAG: hypothetical protein J3R72DRAFT_453806 [Linnemannia gamsii]|nr:MAG: hypothetical protein J3R72DRAFT_453806 [Linnemannia gamsii]
MIVSALCSPLSTIRLCLPVSFVCLFSISLEKCLCPGRNASHFFCIPAHCLPNLASFVGTDQTLALFPADSALVPDSALRYTYVLTATLCTIALLCY